MRLPWSDRRFKFENFDNSGRNGTSSEICLREHEMVHELELDGVGGGVGGVELF